MSNPSPINNELLFVNTSPYSNPPVSPAVDLINLNCLILGDDTSNIFKVQIASTATVGALKAAIKEKRENAFRNVDANALQLWRVSDLMFLIGC